MVNLLSIFVIGAGIMALLDMRREAFPTFSFDLVMVQATYPGSTPEEMERLVTRKIEDELKTVSDIEKVQSTSAEGYSQIIVEIDPDAENKSQVVTDIQQAVDRVPDLPSDMQDKPITTEIRTQDTPVVEIAMFGPLSRKELQDLAEKLEDEIETLDDVAEVNRGGWREKQIWVELDVNAMKEKEISIDEVVQAVRTNDINVPGGTLDTGKTEFLIRTANDFKTPEEFDQIVIRGNETGEIIRLKDVGGTRWAFEEATTLSRTDGFNAVRLVVIKREMGDAIRLVDQLDGILASFKSRNNPNLQTTYINDMSFYVKRRLNILLNNGWIGLIFVLLSLFLLLSRPVATWTILGIPVAFGVAIWIMSLFNISINLITMFGLIMVLGIVVDDAIVVAENVYSYMEKGLSPREAAIRGTQEVVKPITVTVLTTCVAFFPLAIMTGIFGKFIRWVPIVVIITLVASLIECFLILPSHLADFGKARRNGNSKEERPSRFIFFQNLYESLLRFLLNRRWFYTVGMLLFFLVGIIAGFKLIPIQMFPSHGIEIFFVRAEAKLGTSLEETARRFKEIEKIVDRLPDEELKNHVLIAGIVQQDAYDQDTLRGSHVGQLIVYLTPETDRERKTQAIMDQIRKDITSVKGFERVWLDEVRPGPPQGKPVAVRIRGDEYKTLTELATQIEEKIQTIPGTKDIRNDFEKGKDELRVVVDAPRASMAKLLPADVAKTVRWAFQGEVASTIEEGNEDIDVIVRLKEEDRGKRKTFEKLFIQNPRGFHVPLSQVAQIKQAEGITAIKHYENVRTVTVTANIDSEKTTSVEVNQAILPFLHELETQYPGYILEAGGEYEDTNESLDNLKQAGILAAFMIFLILASTFNSLAQPLMIMLAIPFGVFAALIALLSHGEPLSFLAFMGIIGLAGVVINDSIILIDFINKERVKTSNRRESIVTGAVKRLRPVLLTSITTIMGLGPVAYGIGGKDPFLVPMALTIAWGIALGTIMTLTLIPCCYAVLDDMKVWYCGSCFRKYLPKIVHAHCVEGEQAQQDTRDSSEND